MAFWMLPVILLLNQYQRAPIGFGMSPVFLLPKNRDGNTIF